MKKKVSNTKTLSLKRLPAATKVSTDPALIEEVLTRGVASIYPSADFLRARLKSGKRLSLYLGIDPTAPTLHVGHLICLQKLRQFQQLGHQIILLIGDFTGMVGDPTDKTATRVRLTRAQVLENATLYKKQAGTVLSFSGANPARLAYNGSWHRRLNFENVLDLAAHVTVDQLLKRDMFVRRMEEGKPIYLHEFLYPLLQGYDSVALGVDGEIGGNDQTFNMLVGRDLMKQINGTEKFVLASRLLEDPSGKKMGKSEGNMVSLIDSPEEMFGKVMRWTDGMIVPALELCTTEPPERLQAAREALERGENPRDQKMNLARVLVEMVHGPKASQRAQRHFTETFQEKGVPQHMTTVRVDSGRSLGEILVERGVVASKSEFRRLVAQKALEKDSQIVTDPLAPASAGVYRVGKHRFVKIEIH